MNLSNLEDLATKYFSSNPGDRQYAVGALEVFGKKDASDEGPLLAVFSGSNNQYALFYAAQAIVQWTRVNGSNLTVERRQDSVRCVADALRRLVLANRNDNNNNNNATAPKPVIRALISSYAKLMKLGYEKEPYLLDGTACALQLAAMPSCHEEYSLALELLEGIVSEFSNYDSSKLQSFMNFSCHRKCSNNFRDQSLYDVFLMALEALKNIVREAGNGGAVGPNALLSPHHPHLAETVLLVQRCLSYDFMAILVDETEDALSSQFPASWRHIILNQETLLLLWNALNVIPLPHCSVLMKGLSSLCGIRRTFFESPEDRQQYLNHIFTCFLETLMQRRDDRLVVSPAFLNEVGEACCRFVSPFGYRDLHVSTVFFPWLTALKDLTLEVLRRPMDGSGVGMGDGNEATMTRTRMQGDDGSNRDFSAPATTLMNFWGRLSSSLRMYSSNNDENEASSSQMVEDFAMALTTQFFQFRVWPQSSPLTEDTKMLTDAILSQCESVTLLCLLNPARFLSRLGEYFTHQLPVEMLCSQSPSGVMWLLFCAGCFVRTILSNVEENAVSAECMFFRYVIECVRCRQNMYNTMGGAMQADNPTSLFGSVVEIASLHFLSYVHLILFGDRLHVALQSAVSELFQSPSALFQFLLSHTGHNIMRNVDDYNGDENSVAVMKQSIDLIAEACNQMQSSMPQDIQFDLPPVVELPLSQSVRTYRLRTNLYHMLWPLRMPLHYSEEAFLQFISPIDHCIHQTLSGSGNSASFIAGWLRDLRGVARAVQERPDAKADLVLWFCDRAPSIHTVLSGPAGDSPMVNIGFLRFASELISSKHGRNMVDRTSHSANGLLLFKLICGFIQQIVERCITDEKIQAVVSGGPVDGVYEMMLKPLSLCMGLLRICVNENNFVPFGAMWFYKDETYDHTLLGLLRMLSVFPHHIFHEYVKVSNEILRLLRGVAEEQIYHPVVQLSSQEIETILFFVIARCEDVDIPTAQLLHGMSFLSFVAEMIREVKDLSNNAAGSPAGQSPSGMLGGNSMGLLSLSSTPPRSPVPSAYYMTGPDGQGTLSQSGTPGGMQQRQGSARSLRVIRKEFARLLEPMQGLWSALIRVAMNIIVSQDRAISVSCSVVFPIFEAHPPFWFEFIESFVAGYPVGKQGAVRDALAVLSTGGTSSEAFFSEVFNFRQKMREL